jgi:hypothetical protein
MANSYLQFSQVIPHLTQDEETWLRRQLERVHVFGEREYTEEELPKDLDRQDADWIGFRGWRDAEAEMQDDVFVGFQHEFHDGDDRDRWDRYLWVFAEENGNPDALVHLVCKFLRQFRPQECWSLTYAITCSKPRVDEFGGGAAFVTADEVRWESSDEFIRQAKDDFECRQLVCASGEKPF